MLRKKWWQALLVGGAVAMTAPALLAADANKPHPHQGKVAAYKGAPPVVTLDAAQEKVLQTGKPVFKTIEGKSGGRGVAVFLVNAPSDVVWSVIGNYNMYHRWIDDLDESKLLEAKNGNVTAYFRISKMGFDVEYWCKHKFRKSKGWVTWTLDYSKESDLDDSVGFWRIEAVPGNPNQTRVTYSIDIALRGWVPGFIRGILVDNGLEAATEWVKVQSERRAKKAK